jgi:CBS domain-containing protein
MCCRVEPGGCHGSDGQAPCVAGSSLGDVMGLMVKHHVHRVFVMATTDAESHKQQKTHVGQLPGEHKGANGLKSDELGREVGENGDGTKDKMDVGLKTEKGYRHVIGLVTPSDVLRLLAIGATC